MIGVVDKHNPARHVPVEVQSKDTLDVNCLPEGAFHFILIGEGDAVAVIDGVTCSLSARSVVCLNEQQRLTVRSGEARDVQIVSFLPTFLNISMTPAFLRSPDYADLCASHAFFQLAPFLSSSVEKACFSLSEDTFARFANAVQAMAHNLSEQPDWYWSCRARSYFIDIVNELERRFCETLPSLGALPGGELQEEFRAVVEYINNHLHEKLTMARLYEAFRLNKNKLEKLFRVYLGVSVKEYIDRRRFEEATYYLRFTNLLGEEIAHRLSFTSAQYFSRFFVRMSGQTPEAFRREKVAQRKADMQALRQIEQQGRTVREREFY